MQEILQRGSLITKDGETTADEAFKDVKAIGLYFSMHSCPPCRQFTPLFADIYNDVNSGSKQIEVVFVSGDKSQEDFKEYYEEMPWITLPFKDERVLELVKKYEVKGVPRLVMLKPDGTVLSQNAVQRIIKEGPEAIEEFTAGKVEQQQNQMGGTNQKQNQAMESLKSQVQEVISGNPVVVFSKTFCPYCTEAKNILNKANVSYTLRELDTEDDGSQTQEALKSLTGQNTVPNIFIAGNHIGGCSDLKAKIKTGEVKTLLNTNEIPNGF